MAKYQQRKLNGPWKNGYALDLHTISSVMIGHNEYGHPEFDTTYSEVGKLMHRLKYRSDKTALPELVDTAVSFIRSWRVDLSAIVPVPPTRAYRTFQPVLALAAGIANTVKVPMIKSAIRKKKEMPELKNIYDPEERKRLLMGAFEVNRNAVNGQRILLVDDLYRSGATMNAITHVLLASGAAEVYAFAFTQTRTKK
ncbi:MAG TPA: phosphoribosyltransferase family protein [Pyrinomonadaceae bacterium]|nr:phosphoribosyltransferase family protein [Pyrinomonadaceae bacterium]